MQKKNNILPPLSNSMLNLSLEGQGKRKVDAVELLLFMHCLFVNFAHPIFPFQR